jgi:hypothetical protein
MQGGSVQPVAAATHFDYLSATILFPDRSLTITRGRGELEVSVQQLGTAVRLFSDSAASVDEGGYGLLLLKSARFIEQHWNRLLEADRKELLNVVKSAE